MSMKKFPAVYRHVSFRGGLHMVSEQLHYITNREEIFDFSNKKCCIYAACGVSQTPNFSITRRGRMDNTKEKNNETLNRTPSSMTKDETKVDPDDEASTRLFEETDDKEKKQPITTRSYKIKAAVIIVLLITAFVVKDFVIFKDAYNLTGEETWLSQLLSAWFDERKLMLFTGLIILLYPWELTYNIYQDICKSMNHNLKQTRVFAVAVLVAASLIAIFCYIPYTKISRAGLYIFCVIALSLAVCYICRQFFESGIVWFILSVIYLAVITYIYANRICEKADMLFETSLSSAWQMTGYAIWVLIVLFSAAVEVLMIYALYNSESIGEWLIYIIINVMLGIAYGYVVLPVMDRFENGLRRNVSGDYSFVGEPLNSPVVIWMIALLAFIIVLLACASKIVERYSHKRMWMLIWIDVSVLGLLIFGICAKAGIVDNSFSSHSLFDMGSMIAVFIAVRLLIIPIKPQLDLKCRFINPDQEIIDSGYDRKVLEIQIISLQKQLNALVKMTRLTDIKVDMAHKALMIPDDKDEGEEERHDLLDFVEKANKLVDEKKKNGEPVNYSELYSRLMKIRNEEREQIFKIMEAKYNDECMDLDDFDDLDHTDDDSDEDEN